MVMMMIIVIIIIIIILVSVYRILPAMLSYSPSPRVVGSSVPFLGVCSLSSLVWVFPFFSPIWYPNQHPLGPTFFGHSLDVSIPYESFHVDCVHNVFVSMYSSYLVIPYIY